jgi:hypothetical protein
VNFFSEIFGNYWKILSSCETTYLFRQVLKRWIFFRKFSEIIGKYCRGVTRRISSYRFLKGDFFSEIFENYWKILLKCETMYLFRQVLKGWIFFRKFSEIIGNYWKILSRCETMYLFRHVLKRWFFFRNFRKFSEILWKYCRGVRRRISSDRFFRGEFFSEIFGQYWKLLENIVEVWDDVSLQTGS